MAPLPGTIAENIAPKGRTPKGSTHLENIYRKCREDLIVTLTTQLQLPKELETLSSGDVQDIYLHCRQELINELSPPLDTPQQLEPPDVPEEMKHLYRRCRQELIAKLSVAAHVPQDVRYLYRKCRQELIDTLSRSSYSKNLCNAPEEISPTASDVFSRFLVAVSVEETQELFRQLLRAAEVQAPESVQESPYCGIRQLKLPWRAQALWKLVDAKLAHAARDLGCSLRVVIVGGGPVGLRLAIELRAAGHEVVVVEKRTNFSRINRLHLWDWCKADLIALGAKVFDPPGPSFGASPDYCHIGIGELQSMLFKFSLLLGVQFCFGGQYCGVAPAAGGGWHVRLQQSSGAELFLPFDVLAGADGADSAVARTPEVVDEFGRVEIGLRRNSAIGLVANLWGNPRPGLRQFAWARQFAEARFAQLEAQAGISLENCVYYRSGAQHYLVMTPTQESLASQGAFVDPAAEDLTAPANVCAERVRSIAMAAAVHFGLPELDFVDPPNDAQLFDFSGTKRAHAGCAFLVGKGTTDGVASLAVGDSAAMVVLVGDALLEPFWPEGLGIVRGFHSALDTAAAISAWVSLGSEAAQKLSAKAFAILKTLNVKIADRVLQPDFQNTAWTQRPATVVEPEAPEQQLLWFRTEKELAHCVSEQHFPERTIAGWSPDLNE
eukprot:CAMPEP_0171063726 /NCGR_PEP_ID=MMETSP0766_2-20121228/5843_1 /TAXON_ID=439317 /ORGANISM="Gambierdiscus australes, Strain CAWD 149" /LENGTH=664 /DNA_ID=CAMNT_0011519671 /DNA_START=11 /DNA_END=2006 /DNA_ORIENTATION=-